MEYYVCCRELAQQLDEYYIKGDSDRFYELWESLFDKHEDSSGDPNQDLLMLVNFKLMVHFTVIKLLTADEITKKVYVDKFARFLQEKGCVYSKYKELAPYFTIPYISDNPKHFLLTDIQKDEWVQHLKSEWQDLWEKRYTFIHGNDRVKLEKQIRKYQHLKNKFIKLKDDHKSLLDLATRLVAALEESLLGDTKCSVETFEKYSRQIMNYSNNLMNTATDDSTSDNRGPKGGLDVTFQWEARSLRKSMSTETIGSKHSQG